MPLTILAVSDQVDRRLYDSFDPTLWRDVDFIVSCGDLPPYYLDFLCSSLDVPVLYVRGNHDGGFPESAYEGCHNVHGRIVECKGIRVAGLEGSHRYNNGPLQYTERQMHHVTARLRLRALRAGVPDVVISHAPPAGCHDDSDLCHRGFECFNTLIRHWQPTLFIHGHMHLYEPCDTVTAVGATTVLNAYPFQRIQLPVSLEGKLPLRSKGYNVPEHDPSGVHYGSPARSSLFTVSSRNNLRAKWRRLPLAR